MKVYLVDGTYELFRHYFAVPKARDAEGREVGAVRGVLASLLAMMRGGVEYIGVATDHVIESFRNDLWEGYKTGEGVEPDLLSQFPLLEDVLTAAGIVVWPMVEFEADDALASAVALSLEDRRVEQVVICTPDKDLAQCVQASRVVQLIRRTGTTVDEAGVIAKFGVAPESIPDYLALVGDSADGYPGLPGWGAKSTAAVLRKFRPHRVDPGVGQGLACECAECAVHLLTHFRGSSRARCCLRRLLPSREIYLYSKVWTVCGGPDRQRNLTPSGSLLDKAVTEKKPRPKGKTTPEFRRV